MKTFWKSHSPGALHKKLNMLALLLLLLGILVRGEWYERQPLEVHLRNVFRESGFQIPEYVTQIEGRQGFIDFQGDFAASVSFTVKPEDVGSFLKLQKKLWKKPEAFQPIEKERGFGGFVIPAGSYLIEEWETSYNCRYAVDPKTHRIYFHRSST